jgi:cell division protein ZapA
MPLVDITIAGRRHQVQCGEGQESRLKRLAGYVDGKAVEIGQANANLTEARLLLLTSLMISDELLDAYEEMHRLRLQADAEMKKGEATATEAIEKVASRLEQLAAALEKT